MDNYKTIEQKLRNREPFRGNSLTGSYWGETYRITSYSTLIAGYNTISGVAWVTPERYSVTTSRHQNLIKRAWGLN
jgi:hypothetical protein